MYPSISIINRINYFKFTNVNKILEINRLCHGMPAMSCNINENSSEFKDNVKKMKAIVKTFHKFTEEMISTKNWKARDTHLSRNKLLVRDRINKMVDKQTAFLELSQLAGYNLYNSEQLPAGGIVTGIGQIAGVKCMIISNDATVKGGTYYPITVKKHIRAQEIAEQNNLPCIYVVDSGGANLKYMSDVFPDKEHFGRIFYNIARMSAKGIPQIAAVMGSCTAGGAYIPSMCDESVIVKNTGTVFLAGPPLVRAATGELVTAEELGGADVHCRVSGVIDHFAENDEHALQIIRQIISRISNKATPKFIKQVEPTPPKYSSECLYGVINPTNNTCDMRKIIACLVDSSEFSEFKQHYGESLITGFARLNGYLVGIIANNGVLFSDSSLKGTHFIELCCQRQIPLIFLQNISGFMVGKDAEAEGIAKNGAKMVTAVSCAQVPKISVIVGNSYGAGNYGMCGRAFNARFMYMWPNGKIAVMGGEQAAGVLTTVGKMTEEDKKKLSEEIKKKFDDESSACYASARLWDDGVIDPADTREVLSLSLALCLRDCVEEKAQYGVFRM